MHKEIGKIYHSPEEFNLPNKNDFTFHVNRMKV